MSILLVLVYAASWEGLKRDISSLFLTGGFGLVVLAFLEASTRRRMALLHVAVNALMVVGIFLLAAAMSAAGGIVPGLVVILFSYLWIDTRVELSLRRHSMICAECPSGCKMY